MTSKNTTCHRGTKTKDMTQKTTNYHTDPKSQAMISINEISDTGHKSPPMTSKITKNIISYIKCTYEIKDNN